MNEWKVGGTASLILELERRQRTRLETLPSKEGGDELQGLATFCNRSLWESVWRSRKALSFAVGWPWTSHSHGEGEGCTIPRLRTFSRSHWWSPWTPKVSGHLLASRELRAEGGEWLREVALTSFPGPRSPQQLTCSERARPFCSNQGWHVVAQSFQKELCSPICLASAELRGIAICSVARTKVGGSTRY